MYQRTLDRINERVNLLSNMHQIKCEQIKLEMVYSAIENDFSQNNHEVAYEHHDTLQDIELRISILEEQYNDSQSNLFNLAKR